MATLLTYLTVVLLSMLKLMLGPMTALGAGLGALESSLLTALGSACTAVVVGTLGSHARGPILERLRRRFPGRFDRPIDPRLARVFARYGVVGVALVAPPLLSPPGAAIAAVALGIPRGRMIVAFCLSSVLWGAVFTAIIYGFGETLAAQGWITLPAR